MGGQASAGPSGPLGHPYSPGQPPDKSSSEKACGTIKRREKLARKRVLEDEVMREGWRGSWFGIRLIEVAYVCLCTNMSV